MFAFRSWTEAFFWWGAATVAGGMRNVATPSVAASQGATFADALIVEFRERQRAEQEGSDGGHGAGGEDAARPTS